MRSIVRRLAQEGAEAVIAGCTEISLVAAEAMSLPWIDALDRLVEAALREAGGEAGPLKMKEVE